MKSGTKLALGGLVAASVTGYMAFLGATASWQYYLTVDECVDQADSLAGSRVRITGHVLPGSLSIAPDRREASFSLCGQRHELLAQCRGPLPDNLAEGVDVVVEGHLEDGRVLCGDKVITRCASKYQSRSASPSRTAAMPTRPGGKG
jgi:cytochrome c-type biogenesis protein CcmE